MEVVGPLAHPLSKDWKIEESLSDESDVDDDCDKELQ